MYHGMTTDWKSKPAHTLQPFQLTHGPRAWHNEPEALGWLFFVRFINRKCHHCTSGYKLLALTFPYKPAQYWWYPCYDKCHLLNSRVSASKTVQNANRAAPGQHDQCQLHAAAHKIQLYSHSRGRNLGLIHLKLWGHHTCQFSHMGDLKKKESFKESFVWSRERKTTVKSRHTHIRVDFWATRQQGGS